MVATLNQQPFMVVVAANSPYKTLGELTEAMKQKGDKASYAESNTTGKVMGELYKIATGVKARRRALSYRERFAQRFRQRRH